jgi:hypothetical protein
MVKRFDAAAAALSAIANVSRVPAARADVKRMLVTGTGEPSHVMALFGGDVSLTTLIRLVIAFEISDVTLARAYVRARDEYAAANAELDEFAAELGISAPRIEA